MHKELDDTGKETEHRFRLFLSLFSSFYIRNNFTNAIAFIIVNQLVRIVANAALRIVVLITPIILPTKYIGTKTLVAGSSTVKVNVALAPPTNTASQSSQ